MKSVILSTASAMLLFAYGCKKDKLTTTPQQQANTNELTVHDGLLHFGSATYYDEVLSGLSKGKTFYQELSKLKFTSLEETSNTDKELVKAEFLKKVLNKDNAFAIGKYIYRINMLEEKVYVLPIANIDQYADLVNQNSSNKTILTYSFADNVIAMVESGTKPNTKSLFCGESGMGSDSRYQGTTIDVPGAEHGTMAGGIYYDRYGVYFNLYARGWLNCDNRRLELHLTPVYYKIKCGGATGPYYSWNYQLTQGSTGTANPDGATYQSYQGSQPLNAVWFRAVFMAKRISNYNDPDPSVDIELRVNY